MVSWRRLPGALRVDLATVGATCDASTRGVDAGLCSPLEGPTQVVS